MLKFRFAPLIVLGAYAALLYADKQQAPVADSLNSAEEWADAVVGIVTDPHVYSWNTETTSQRFAGLVGALQPIHGHLMGRNSLHGILYVEVDCGDRLESADIIMPLFDSQGHEVYPLVREKLKKKLRSPWSYIVDNVDKSWIFWRKGKSRFVVDLRKRDFATDPAGPAVPEPGPYIILRVGEEEGDSE